MRATEISVAYGGKTVLDQATLGVAPGELLGVIGANGAGKSTLLRCLAGASVPDAGSICIGADAYGDLMPELRARLVGYLPQRPRVEWPMPVEEVAALGRLPHQPWWQGVDATAQSPEVAAALEACDVGHLRGRAVDTLSGGEFARVMMARLLAGGHEVLIADEPISDLDPPHRVDVLNILKSETRKGRAALVALHDLSLADRYCDRVVVLLGGRIIAQGTPGTIFEEGVLTRAFGAPCRVTRSGGQLIAAFDGSRPLADAQER